MAFGISAGTYLVAGAGLVGAKIASDSAGGAEDAQAAAAAQSDATQRYMYDTTRADNAPFRDTGIAANNRLAYLMGIGTNPAQNLQANRSDTGAFKYAMSAFSPSNLNAMMAGGKPVLDSSQLYTPEAHNNGQTRTDQEFGSLSRSFTAQDLANDQVYNSGLQFGLDQGVRGLNRQAAAGGNFLSGAALKALTRFGNDYGSTKANESYNRFNTDQNAKYNKLAGLSGAGQQATNQVSSAGQNMANNISQSQQGVGNARGSSYLTQGNAWQNALNSGISAYRSQNNTDFSQSPDFFNGTGAWRA